MTIAKEKIAFSNDWEMRIASTFLMISIFGLPDITRISYVSRGVFVLAFLVFCVKSSGIMELKYASWAMILSMWGALNCLFSYSQSTTVSTFLTMLQAVWIGCFEYNWLRKSKRYSEVVLSIVAGGLILCVRLFRNIDYTRWGTRKIGTMLGVNVNALSFRIVICFVLLLALTYAIKERRVLRTCGMVLCMLFVFFIVIMGSRRALIICFVTTMLIILGYANNFAKTLKGIMIILAAVVGVYILINEIPALNNIIGRRLQSFMTALFRGGDILDDGRGTMINTAIELFFQRPIFGWGMGTFRLISGIDNAYSHNTYVELLYTTGFPGVFFYYSILIVVIIKLKGLRKRNSSRILCIALLATMLMSDFVAVNYSSIVNHILIALMMGLSEGGLGRKY